MAINNRTDIIMSKADFFEAKIKFGEKDALNMLHSSPYSNSTELNMLVEQSPNADTSAVSNQNAYNKYATTQFGGLAEGENRITGGYDLDTSAAWFGGKNNTGIISGIGSAVGVAADVGNTVLAYKQFEQTKEDNAKKFALMQESNLMKRTQMHNRVAEARRRSATGRNNSNNQTTTLNTAVRNPYLDAQYSRVG